jgi:hypothetical protein
MPDHRQVETIIPHLVGEARECTGLTLKLNS